MNDFWRFNTILILLGSIILSNCSGCKNRNERVNETKTENKLEAPTSNTSDNTSINLKSEINKVIFFLENSGSLRGYVNGDTDFKTSVTALGHFPDFDGINKTFYFISGKAENCKVDFIGNTSETLDLGLNSENYKESYSDLTKMFEVALDSAQKNIITLLITDGLYDVGESDNPKKALEREVEKTQETFRNKLSDNDIETIIIKAYSNFKGSYCYASKKGSSEINQQRPYYIFIFGNNKLLNELTEEKFNEKIKGFANIARFLKLEDISIPYQITNENKLGEFRPDREYSNRLINVKPDRNGQGFQFSFATDYSTLPYTDSYFEKTDNYLATENYDVTAIEKVDRKIHEVTSFTPTHLITVFTAANPYCELSISIKNEVPTWIVNTNSEGESNIKSDTTQTFGFKFLTDAISKAYKYKNREKYIAEFTIEINR